MKNLVVAKRSLIGLLVVVVAGLIATVLIPRPSSMSAPAAAATGDQDRVALWAVRGAGFDFADHELRYAGGYGLRPASAVLRGADFDFVDHEFRYAGSYGLRVSAAPRGVDFDFLDHELRYAGGYGLIPVASDRSP